MLDPSDPSHSLGDIRIILRPEWSPSAFYADKVATAPASTQHSTVYRLEPGFLIQGSLRSRVVPANKDTTKAPKVMERGEVGWAGGGAGPDFFIYLGTGPASWLGNPHDGTIFAEVADEASMAVAANVSLLPMPYTPPGQMHVLKQPVQVVASPWSPPPGGLDVSASAADALAAASLSAPPAPPLGLLKVAGAALDEQTSRCNASCHALARTELHGSVVMWGEKHLQPDAAHCCEACARHAAGVRAGQKPCNVWVYCSSAPRCGKRYQQCWLKHATNLWADTTLLVGTSDAWTAGTAERAPEAHPSGAGRTLPAGAEADLAVSIATHPKPITVRLRLRGAATPRAAARVAHIADDHQANDHQAAARGGALARATASGLAPSCEDGPARLLGATSPPAGYGNESVDDGVHALGRWVRGGAMLRGTLGRALPGMTPWANASGNGPTAVEPQPVAVRRGSVAWAVSGGDGPTFFVALADMPHLGVSLTVWAEVVDADLAALDELAAAVSDGRVSLPAALHVGRVRRRE